MELIHTFESICSSNGDDVAFFTSSLHHQGQAACSAESSNTSPSNQNNNTHVQTVGFSELNENVNIIASELYFRHNIRYHLQERASRNTAAAAPNSTNAKSEKANICTTAPPSLLVVSSYPSPGEAASVLACTKLQTPFVPLSIHGPHGVSQSRVKTIISETKPIAAIVVLSIDDDQYRYTFDDNEECDESRPALSNVNDDIMMHLDSNNDTIRTLNTFGVYRIVVVNARDGSIIGGTITTSECTDFSNVQKEISDTLYNRNNNTSEDDSCTCSVNDGADQVAYILYTSGSTNKSKPKAVIQTYKSIINRIKWQWKIFPFVQQMKKQFGYNETVQLLSQDGIVAKTQQGETCYKNAIFIPPLNDIVMRRTSLSFVDSIAEIYGSLLAGCPLWCPLFSSNDEINGRRMGLIDMFRLASKSGVNITRLTCLPSQFSQALRLDGDQNMDKVTEENHITKCIKAAKWIQELSLVIVSGEPCPISLVTTFEKRFTDRRALLVNLYGQTETAGDVSCAVVGFGRCENENCTTDKEKVEYSSTNNQALSESISRFPQAHKYFWSRARNSNQHQTSRGDENIARDQQPTTTQSNGLDIERLKTLLVPCGFSIDGHSFVFKKGGNGSKIGCLHVKGAGVALGYLNNEAETSTNFSIVNECNIAQESDDTSVVLFNTMDMAFQDKSTQALYIFGRAPQNSEKEGGVNIVSSTMGKINGVMIHVAEMEKVFSVALRESMSQHHIVLDQHSDLSVIGAILNDDEYAGNSSKSAIFVDFSSISGQSMKQSTSTGSRILDCNIILSSSEDKQIDATFHDIFTTTRSVMSSPRSPHRCHPAIIPNYIFLLDCFPCNGAAGKIDRSALICHAKSELQKNKEMNDKDNKRKVEVNNRSNSVDISFLIKDIIDIYSKTLGGIQCDENMIKASMFHHLGGDSMMAIDVSHRIMKVAQSKGVEISPGQTITANDLFENTIPSLYSMVVNGREIMSQNSKRPRLNTGIDSNTAKLGLQELPDATIYNETKAENKLDLAWKLRLLMCVDAKPTIISSEGLGLIAVGSQGGDCCIANSAGKALSRLNVNGKVEGEMSLLERKLNRDEVQKYILYVCSYDIQYPPDGNPQRFGYVNAFEMESTGGLKRLWQYALNGEIKNKPVVFSLLQYHRIVAGSYNGTIIYLDAITGKLLDKLGNGSLGGAIHADPIVIVEESQIKARAIVASSTWIGKVSCLCLDKESINALWQIEISSPIYSTPVSDADSNVIFIFAIDGSMRLIDASNGKECWVKFIAKRPIFSSGCFVRTRDKTTIVFGSHDGFIRCVNIDGGIEWTFNTNAAILSTPLAVDNFKRLIIPTSAGAIYSLSSDTGLEDKEPLQLDGEIFSSPCAGISHCEGTEIYVGCRDSCIYKIRV